MMNYGLLANQGRREDNALMGGQVAHISQQDAQILRALGGAGTTNPATGLPEYFNAGLAGQGFGPGGASFSGFGPGGGTAASFGSFGQGTGGTASGVTGVGPGSSGVGSGLAGASLGLGDGGATSAQSAAKLAQTKAIAEAKLKAKSLTNWGDAVLSGDMATITQLGKDAYVKNAFDNAMDALALNYAKYAPLVNLGEAIFGPGPEGPITFLGEAIYGEGDGQTQTIAQTVAPPAISPTYAPTTGSIPSPLPLPPVPIAPPAPVTAPVVQTATAAPYAGGLSYTPLPAPTTGLIPTIPTYSLV